MARSPKQPCYFVGMYEQYATTIIAKIKSKYGIDLVYHPSTIEGYGDLRSSGDISIGINRYAEIKAYLEGYKAGLGS